MVTAVAAFLAKNVQFESAIEVWFVEDDPALVTYDKFTHQFAADEMVVIALTADVFTEATFIAIDELSAGVARAPHVHRVRSVLDFELDPPLPFDAEDIGSSAPNWQTRKLEAAENTLITPTLVSENGQTAALIVEVERSGNTVEGKRALVSALDQIISEAHVRGGYTIQLTGTPVLDHRAFVYNEHDLNEVYPLIVPFIVLFCWLVFGSLTLALIPLLTVACAVVWAFGVMGALGLKTTLLSSALLPLFLAIGVADAIHVLTDYQRQRSAGKTAEDATSHAIERLWKPCLFTSVTTAAGLGALLLSDLRPVREFGLIAAIGVLSAFVLTMTLLPALLSLAGRRLREWHSRISGILTAFLNFFVNPPDAVRRWVIVISLAVGALSILSATRIEIGVDPMSWFRAEDPFRQATAVVDEQLGAAPRSSSSSRHPPVG